MTWFIGLIGFIIGIIAGAMTYKLLKSDEAKVKSLEEQLDKLQREFDSYKDNVHSHFNNSAQLLTRLTESYREVYRHMASGAQALCPEYISEQLSHSARAQESLTRDSFAQAPEQDTAEELTAPRDYAAKTSPDQKGNLSEDFGLNKVSAGEKESP